ncbi:MAG: hypothetical protein AB7K41_03455 [Bdellovibrionales bacterium]
MMRIQLSNRGSALIPIMVVVGLLGTLTASYMLSSKNSAERSSARTYSTNIEAIRSAVRAAVEDPLLCTQMLRGQRFPTPIPAPGVDPSSDPVRGTEVSLNMNYGPMPLGQGPLSRGWPHNPAAPREWATIGGVRLWAGNLTNPIPNPPQSLGFVVLDRPRSAANNPREHWYHTYEARLLIYGLQGKLNPADPNSREGRGGGIAPTPNSPVVLAEVNPARQAALISAFDDQSIPLIVHVSSTNPNVIAGCYGVDSTANFCRSIDNYRHNSVNFNPPIDTAIKITGGYDFLPAQGTTLPTIPGTGIAEADYANFRCHPEICTQYKVPGRPAVFNTGAVTCPPPTINRKLGPTTEACLWCNRNIDMAGTVPPNPLTATEPPERPCAAEFEVSCFGTSRPGQALVKYSLIVCDDDTNSDVYMNITRGRFGTGWILSSAPYNLNYATSYTNASGAAVPENYRLTASQSGSSVTINGAPDATCTVPTPYCQACTDTQSF